MEVYDESVPADQVDERISQWAGMARAEDAPKRVAGLLNVQPRNDPGHPQYLALSNNPSAEQLAAETAATVAEPAVAVAAAAEPQPVVAEPAVAGFPAPRRPAFRRRFLTCRPALLPRRPVRPHRFAPSLLPVPLHRAPLRRRALIWSSSAHFPARRGRAAHGASSRRVSPNCAIIA